MTGLERLDWSLIPTLHVLLEERNVSRAARRLHISQPAASAALARLRRRFDDPLLVRRGAAYELTPLGDHLLPLARGAMEAGRTMLEAQPEFDAGTSERVFTLAASDYGQAVVGPALVAAFRASAPRASLAFRYPLSIAVSHDEVLSRVDGWLAPREVMSGRPSSGALADEWVCVVSADHPHEDEAEELARRPWVMASVGGRPMQLQLDGLSAYGVHPRVRITTETFSSIPSLVVGNDSVGLVQRRLAQVLAPPVGARWIACPWPLPPLGITMWWATERRGDPGHRWFRHAVRRSLEEVGTDKVVSRST